jgi:hypothetical protein
MQAYFKYSLSLELNLIPIDYMLTHCNLKRLHVSSDNSTTLIFYFHSSFPFVLVGETVDHESPEPTYLFLVYISFPSRLIA